MCGKCKYFSENLFFFQKFLIGHIDTEGAKWSCDYDSRDCGGQDDFAAGQSGSQRDGTNSGLYSGFGQVGNDAEETFFSCETGTGSAQQNTT